ncbi:MAG TPA: enoyl-CoA hydratase [Beijerinckiaceae bacterium]|jgi:enoyl-CoA hydratase/carnithine racemase|nr:enoyl-CoA hydratase [Beijerinckiaceae bacterium]
MAYEQILYRVEERVAVVTLNRPDRLNAWTPVMQAEVKAAMRAASGDPQVRVIVLTGAGRGFCAGADMSALQGIQSGERRERAPEEPFDRHAHQSFQRTHSYFPSVPKPIIAAVNGPCAGLGMVIALYADMRFASQNAVFMTAFSRRGLIAEHGISWLLPRLVGLANAADLLFSARRVEAREAKEIGLVNRVFAAEKFETEVLAYAKMLASEVSPRSLAEMKREIWNAQFQTLGEAIEAADKDMAASFASEDFKEGVAHFVEKRAPAFTGR